MFKKLLANLPFNPGLLEEVIFYQNRVKKEARLRLFGLLAVILAVSVQIMFLTSSPAHKFYETADQTPFRSAVGKANELPQISKHSLIIFDGCLLFFAAWLYVRSRIIIDELEIIRQNFITTGGM